MSADRGTGQYDALALFVHDLSMHQQLSAILREQERCLLMAATQVVTSRRVHQPAVSLECERVLISVGLAVRARACCAPQGSPQWADVASSFAGLISGYAAVAEHDCELSRLLDTTHSAALLSELIRSYCRSTPERGGASLCAMHALGRSLFHAAANCSSCNWKSLKTILATCAADVVHFSNVVASISTTDNDGAEECSEAAMWTQLFRFVGNASFGSLGAKTPSCGTDGKAEDVVDGALLFKSRLVDELLLLVEEGDGQPGLMGTALAFIRGAGCTELCGGKEEERQLSALVAARWACHMLSNLCYGGAPNGRQRAMVQRWSSHVHVFSLLIRLHRHSGKKEGAGGAAPSQLGSAVTAAVECLNNLLFRFPFVESNGPPLLVATAEWRELTGRFASAAKRCPLAITLESGNWLVLE